MARQGIGSEDCSPDLPPRGDGFGADDLIAAHQRDVVEHIRHHAGMIGHDAELVANPKPGWPIRGDPAMFFAQLIDFQIGVPQNVPEAIETKQIRGQNFGPSVNDCARL